MEEIEFVLKYRIDDDGLIIDVEYTDETSASLIVTSPVDGMFIPKWNGSEWIENDTTAKVNHDGEVYKGRLLQGVIQLLDSVCLANGFNGDDTTRPYRAIANYVGYDNVYRDKAESLGNWIASVFSKSQEIQDDVIAGTRSIPTSAEVMKELPVYVPIA